MARKFLEIMRSHVSGGIYRKIALALQGIGRFAGGCELLVWGGV